MKFYKGDDLLLDTEELEGDVGTTAGTVAAGDDSRFTDARTPTDGSVSTVKIVDGAVTPIKVGSRYVAKTSAYTLTAADEVVDCTSGTFTVTLPNAASFSGRMFTVKNSGTGTITIGRTSSQTIDGANANVVLAGKGSFTVLSTGAAWIVIQGGYVDESVGRRIFTWDQTNARWQMTYGDTGLREILTTAGGLTTYGAFPNADWGPHATNAGYIRLRRIGFEVITRFQWIKALVGDPGTVQQVPTGFRAVGNPVAIPAVNTSTGAAFILGTSFATGSIYRFSGSFPINSYLGNYSVQEVRWITEEAWPSSLPGIASGSIPS
jgi:hypothetical protein